MSLTFTSSVFIEMSFTFPFPQTSTFVDLLNQQQENYVDESFDQVADGTSQSKDRRERRLWTPSDDVLLISSWLNTSKDPVVGNEQKSGTFWKRIAAYFAASSKEKAGEKIEASQCKQRWHKINDMVCKFCGSYEAATRQKSSGQNENDIIKLAHEIYYNTYKKKFNLEHCWNELKYDQKWCDQSYTKPDAGKKKRKTGDGSESVAEEELSSTCSAGVKAAKGKGKRAAAQEKTEAGINRMMELKEKDLLTKERMSRMNILESLIAKQGPISAEEETLKKKLIAEMLA